MHSRPATLLLLLARLEAFAATVAVRSAHDGLCLRPHPLRFDACGPPALPLSAWTRRKRVLDWGGFVQLRLAEPALQRLCVDRFCVRCVSRGNANRARVSLCATSGFEAVEVIDAERAAAEARYQPPPWLLLALLSAGTLGAWAYAVQRHRIAALAAASATDREETRRIRLDLRESRDVARPARLQRMMREGGFFYELGEGERSGGALPVLLRLDAETSALDIYDASNLAVLGVVPPQPTLRRLRVPYNQIRRMRFAQPSGGAARTAVGHPASCHEMCTSAPWRCLEIELTDGGSHLFVGETDDQAMLWFMGLQELLHSLGEMLEPVRAARLLWARARLRLAARARADGVRPWEPLIGALRAAQALPAAMPVAGAARPRSGLSVRPRGSPRGP